MMGLAAAAALAADWATKALLVSLSPGDVSEWARMPCGVPLLGENEARQ